MPDPLEQRREINGICLFFVVVGLVSFFTQMLQVCVHIKPFNEMIVNYNRCTLNDKGSDKKQSFSSQILSIVSQNTNNKSNVDALKCCATVVYKFIF